MGINIWFEENVILEPFYGHTHTRTVLTAQKQMKRSKPVTWALYMFSRTESRRHEDRLLPVFFETRSARPAKHAYFVPAATTTLVTALRPTFGGSIANLVDGLELEPSAKLTVWRSRGRPIYKLVIFAEL